MWAKILWRFKTMDHQEADLVRRSTTTLSGFVVPCCIAPGSYSFHLLADGLLIDINVFERIHHHIQPVEGTLAREGLEQCILFLAGQLLGKLPALVGGEIYSESAVE